jgi:hypothetical protein
MKRFHTATLSHDELRSAIWMQLDQVYPGQADVFASWPMLVEVYDGFCLAKCTVDSNRAMYKIPYTIGAGDNVSLGTPTNVLEADARSLEERVQFIASKVAFGEDAQALLKEMEEKNPLIAAIKDSPNTHLVVFDLTSVGRPSKHAGKIQYQLAKKGLAAALPTLITKPIHVTNDLDAHFEAGRAPKAIGAFLGGIGLENDDGTMTLRAIGTLWDSDFPDEVAEIQKKQAELGASYEIAYLAASAERLNDHVVEIGKYEFSGGAILKKNAAAHPETQLLVANKDTDKIFDVMDEDDLSRLLAYLSGSTSFTRADKLSYQERNNLKDSDFALIQEVDGKKVRRFPIHDEAHRKNAWARLPQAKGLSEAERAEVANKIINKAKSAGDDWAKDYTKSNGKWVKKEGGANMPKYTGIPAELEAAVDTIVAALKAELKAEQDKALATLKAEHDKAVADLKAKAAKDPSEPDADDNPQSKKNKETTAALEAEKSKVVELTNQVTALTASKEKLTSDVADRETKLAEIEMKAKLAQTIAEMKADYGLTDEQLKEEKRAALVAKLAAGKEALSAAEFKQLISGGKVAAGKDRDPVPLFAGVGDGNRSTEPDAAAIARTFPAAVPAMRRVR